MSQTNSKLASHSHWACMSSDLLVLIFERVAEQESKYKHGSHLCQLPLVCVRFRNTFYNQAQLSETISIPRQSFKRQFDEFKLASLMTWIRRHGARVKQVQYVGLEVGLVLLGALLSHGAPLQELHLDGSTGAIQMLSAFHTLRQVQLSFGLPALAQPWDLKPLQALPNLDDLALASGMVENLHAAAAHLTSLCLNTCVAYCSQDCMCVTSLSQLVLTDSSLENFHALGMVACCSLKSLTCNVSDLPAGDTMHSEDFDFTDCPYRVPASLSALTSLTKLRFACSGDRSAAQLDWLTCLPALRVVSAEVWGNDAVLPYCLTAMTNLSTMVVITGEEEVNDYDVQCQIKPMFDWKALTALTRVEFHGSMRVTDQFELSDLASLTNLKVVRFARCHHPDLRVFDQLAALAHKLGKDRPDVAFIN